MIMLKNAHIITCESEEIEKGYIIIEETHIKEVGKMENVPLFSGEEIDLDGKYIMPGMIDAHTHLGMWGYAGTKESRDLNESSSPITPHLRAIDAINPLDEYFSEALMGGVTTVCTGPGSANPIAGTFAVIKTKGNCVDDMAIKKEAAMKFSFGENPKSCHSDAIKTRMGTAAIIREALFKAREYDGSSFDMKSHTLKSVTDGKMLVKAHAHRADDIFTALRIADEFNLKISIEHCTEGHLICDKLKNVKANFCIGPILGDKSKPELRNKTLDTMLAFEKAGIDFSIISDHPEIVQSDLLLCIQMAVRHGLSKDTAIKAVTINPATALGVEDRIGSIKEGKDADLVVFDKHPLDFNAKVVTVFVNGEK